MYKKIIITIGFTILFLGVGIQPAFADNISLTKKPESENDCESFLGWQTYRFCYISGEFYLDMFPDIFWFGPFPIVKIWGYSDLTLTGSKGEVEPSEILGFGF